MSPKRKAGDRSRRDRSEAPAKPSYASRCRRKAALIDELRSLPAGGGNPMTDQRRGPTPRTIGERREWLQAELEKLEDVPILSHAELRRLPGP